jgi:hypothetical protein
MKASTVILSTAGLLCQHVWACFLLVMPGARAGHPRLSVASSFKVKRKKRADTRAKRGHDE